MRTLGRLTLALAAIAVFAAIWMPTMWWQFGLTALVLLLVAAGILGTIDQETQEGGQEHAEGENGTGSRPDESDAAERHTGPRKYGRSNR